MNDILIGQIASAVQLHGQLNDKENMSGSFNLFELPEHQYSGSYLITPTESDQVLPTSGRTPLSNITVKAIPEEYIVPSGTVTISQYGDTDVKQYASATVPSASFYTGINGMEFFNQNGTRKWRVRGLTDLDVDEGDTEGWISEGGYFGEYEVYNAVSSGTTITPTESSQTIGGANYMMESAVTVSPIPSEYIVPSGTLSITANGVEDVTQYASVDVSIPATGLIQSKSYTVSNYGTVDIEPDEGYAGMSVVSVTTPSASVSAMWATGYATSGSLVWYFTPRANIGKSGWANEELINGNTQYYSAIQSGTSVTPSESAQTIGGADTMMRGAVTINAIPSNYVGTGVPRGYDDTLSLVIDGSDATVVAASGYYQSNAEKVIPFASISQSISYEQSTGVITATGTFPSSGYAVSGSSFSASSKISLAHATLKSNGTYYAINDDNDAWTGVTVSVSSPAPSLQSKSATPTESELTITPDYGYDGLSQVTVGAISPTYIGSSVPRRSSVVYFEEDGVTVEDGYYSSAFFTQIPKGSLYGWEQFYVSPSFSVDDNGVVWAEGAYTRAYSPVYSAGWLDTSTSMSIFTYTTGSYQLTVGNSITYGNTDRTAPIVGVGQVGYAEL